MRGTCQHRAPLIIAETSCVRLSSHQGQSFSVCGQLCGQTKKGPRQLAKPFLFFGDKRACRCGDLISIHAPAREATTAGIGANLYLAFQSTSPTRGATGRGHSDADGQSISIHSPARRATSRNIMSTIVLQFQSTSPVRGTTSGHKFLGGLLNISIHVPAEGDDPP